MTHIAITRISTDLTDARDAGDEPLVAHLEPQLERAQALERQIIDGTPADTALQRELAKVTAELASARRRVAIGTRDPDAAKQNAEGLVVLDAARRAITAEAEAAREAVQSPAAALDRMGVDRAKNEALRLTSMLAELAIDPRHSGVTDGRSYPEQRAVEQAERATPEVLIWWPFAERATLRDLAERRSKAQRRDAVYHVGDADLEALFETRRRALEQRRRRLANESERKALEAERLSAEVQP